MQGRVRHVKCGEEKPYCQKCISTDRKCDGYDNQTQWDHRRRLGASRGPSTILSGDNRMVLAPGSKEERQLVYTFFTQASESVAGSIPSDLWARLIPQLTYHRPMVRHVIVAVSAAYIQQAQPAELISDRAGRFITQQYNKAIQDFIKLASRIQSDELELLLTTRILFICLELIRGNQGQAINHTEGGVRILQTKQAKAISMGNLDREISQLLVRFNSQLPYLGRPLILQCEPNLPIYEEKFAI
ncbi:hypothetical protein N7507_007212 [Penicillium longicatenatum]|nr:hypothetical protein N7507_007212 [Penicillium longicatenatum]